MRDMRPLQSENADAPMLVNEFESVRDVSPPQRVNARNPRRWTEFGSVRDVSPMRVLGFRVEC